MKRVKKKKSVMKLSLTVFINEKNWQGAIYIY